MKNSLVISVLEKAIEKGHPMMLSGAPGTGKSDAVEQACRNVEKRIGKKVVLIISHPVVSDPTDFKGMPAVITVNGKSEAHFLPFNDLQKIIDTDPNTIVVFFLDDLGQAPGSVQAAAQQLTLARRINGFKVADNVVFIAATNRKCDKAGVTGILEPVKSRYTSIFEVTPDLEDWCKWAHQHNVPSSVIGFIRFRPNLLWDFKPSADMTNSPCPRTVANVGKILEAEYPAEAEFELIKGAAGEGFAIEFSSFLKVYRQLPNPDSVIANPKGADVPKDPATMYALVSALVARCTVDNFAAIMEYGARIPKEFEVTLWRDCCSKDSKVNNTKTNIEWITKNAEVVV